MTLEQQVCSLDLAKRLKELGIGIVKHTEYQNSLFYWVPYIHNEWRIEYADGRLSSPAFYSAFTVSELGEMLPVEILNPPDGSPFWSLKIWKNAQGEWGICLDSENRREIAFIESEADARAKMLIHLLENKLVTL